MRRHPFVMAALGMGALFLALHLGGGRESVGLLSGTVVGGPWRMGIGVAYALSWFGTVLVAPALLLAGLADVMLGRVRRARH
ncbi:hypothetical protein [Corallococcus aberystwythensis]|uniref:Uncharacterized protein n=1 Tax=Corallococcus aberystwythensis TaxID=2316722 RepID=A0A3A8QFH7_9BACT|nr:hypothetical protein [Corallococcus aberystwythensis]RKH67459.1 hypothetical protein D7W81_13880 [Corallococcus aberystwythensis]